MFRRYLPHPHVLLQQSLNEMLPFLVSFKELHFHRHLDLVQPQPHPFSLGLLCLRRSPTTLRLWSPLRSPHLEHVPLMTPNLSVIQPKSLAISLLCVVVSPYCTTNIWKASSMAKNSLDVLSTSFGLASSCVLGDLSTSRRSKAYLPPLFFLFD